MGLIPTNKNCQIKFIKQKLLVQMGLYHATITKNRDENEDDNDC